MDNKNNEGLKPASVDQCVHFMRYALYGMEDYKDDDVKAWSLYTLTIAFITFRGWYVNADTLNKAYLEVFGRTLDTYTLPINKKG